MTTAIRTTQIESAVRAAIRGGAQVVRVIVDHRQGRIVIEAAPSADAPRTFDTVDFTAQPRGKP